MIVGSRNRVTRNLATENGAYGFQLFTHGNDGHVVSSNVASGSQMGFDIQGVGHVISGNLASENSVAGFALNFGPHTFTGNSAIGNTGVGIWTGLLFGTTITKNNIYGNDPAGNCGIRNSTSGVLAAHGNFWGTANGPGDPSNRACDAAASETTTVPAATRELATNVVKVQ